MSSTKALLVALCALLLAAPVAAQQPVQVVSETGGVVAGTPADAETNTEPFLARAGMRGYFFNGATWDRMRGDTTSGLWVNVKNASLSVTGSGTFTTNQTGWNGTAVDTNSGGKSAGTLRVVIATDQPALTNKLLVTPDSVALPANQSVNTAQFGGTNVSTGTGAGGAGIPRVTISNDSSLAANQSVNVAQMNGVATTMGNGVAGTGVQRVAVASDNTPFESIPVATATTTDGVITTNCYITSAASTNSTNCKASAGNVYFIHVTNTTTTNYFLRLYNSSSAPTCSSATGFVETIPALGASVNGGVNGRVNVIPQSFTTGIGFCLTGGGSSTDNTNAATGVYLTIGYK